MDRARLIDLVGEALDLPPADRESFLRARCDDPGLLAEGLSLIAAAKTAGGFLGRPTVRGLASAPEAEGVGSTLGPYRLLELIGEGPSARVYLAEQREPVLRRVAIKVFKPGLAPPHLGGFEAARSALTPGRHPGIALPLDSGTTDSGAAFFAVEPVRGEPIAAHCDRVHASPGRRLALFREVCGAVRHAHACGVFHGGLGSRNVQVSSADGRARVLDFGCVDRATPAGGIASRIALEVRAAHDTSPEVAAGGPPDARADVYSLGVLLRELAGRDPRLGAVIARATRPDPAHRFESVADMEHALDACVRRSGAGPATARPALRRAIWWCLIGAAFIAAGVIALRA